MLLEGRVHKEGKFWISECEALDATTQGNSKQEAIRMLADWIQTAIDDSEFPVNIKPVDADLEIRVEPSAKILALMLQRTRQKIGLTVREAAKALGFKSHNAYSQYENGQREPSISQLERFLEKLSPDGEELMVKIG
jgi:predicted RNase H-like HicB family nuclease/DNA-binding XRE family transcriptional regulator